MATKIWILGLLLLSLSAGTSGQEDYCYSDQWFVDMGLCFVQKYTNLIRDVIDLFLPTQAAYHHDTRRSLQSMAMFDPQVNIVGNTEGVQYTIDRLIAKAQRMHNDYLSDDIMDAVLKKVRKLADPNTQFYTSKMTSDQKKRFNVLEKLTKVDTTKVTNKLTEEVASVAYEMQSAFMNILSSKQMQTLLEIASNKSEKTLNFNNMNPYADITNIFDQLLGLIDMLHEQCILCETDPGCLLGVLRLEDLLCTGPVDALVDELTRVLQCFSNNFTVADFEDGIEWAQCLFECSDVPDIGECVRSVSSTCDTPIVGDLALEIAAEYLLGLSDCKLDVPNVTIDVEEGGEVYNLEIRSYLPHTLYCLDFSQLNTPIGMIGFLVDWIMGGFGECPVEIQVSTHNYLYPILSIDVGVPGVFSIQNGWPRCRDFGLVNQALIGRHEHDEGECSCSVVLNGDTWNETHTFPISAAIDNKVDGNIEAELTVKLRVKGFIVQSVKLPMNIIDGDSLDPVCASLGDPHVISFDKSAVDNYYEGYFQLYKHLTLPYEVQVIQQNCSVDIDASCTCAVAVRTGDDVFKVDRCRVEGSDDVPPTTVVMYVNGILNPGTRVFIKEDGKRFEIVLPIGTIVTMILGEENSINVWIAASATDRSVNSTHHRVLGLCGTYDENKRNDNLMPDGSSANPNEFIESWRIAEDDLIFRGAVKDESLEIQSEMCKCIHVLMFGVQCRCGYDLLVDLCDFDTEGEITSNIQMISRQSDKQRMLEGLEPNWPYETIAIDVDDTSQAPNGWPDGWTQWAAKTACEDAVEIDPMIKKCTPLLLGLWGVDGFSTRTYREEIEGCIEDIRITNSTAFISAAVESAKFRCTVLRNQATGVLSSYPNVVLDDCLYSCNGNGVCNQGVCQCYDGFSGSDCSITDTTADVTEPATLMCDTRGSTCEYASLIGHGFKPEEENITFYIQQNELTSSGTVVYHDETRQTYVGTVITPNQIACQLPDSCLLDSELCTGSQAFGGIYEIEIPDITLKPTVIVYDSACYACTSSPSCEIKDTQDYCLIASSCYSAGSLKPDDECRVCEPDTSMSEWSVTQTQECIDAYNEAIDAQNAEDREDIIRIVVASILSGTVILVAIILYLTIGRLKKSEYNDGVKGMNVSTDDQFPGQKDAANDFISATGVTLVRKKSGEVNDGFDFASATYENETPVYDNEVPAGTSDGRNGDAILY